MRKCLAVIGLCWLAGCASPPHPALATDAAALLLGEQHDAAEHRALQRAWIESLARRGRLAAVALEMAERGTSTAGLARGAGEPAVRDALRWNEQAWPWASYRAPVMAAVQAGVPVLGANLPREEMRVAMADAALDALLAGPALKAQQQAIRRGHCELLPETQIRPMTRVQIARDRAMAQAVAAAAVPGKTVVLIAGAGHVDAEVGVPRHLPPTLRFSAVQLPAQPAQRDYCEDLRRQMQPVSQAPEAAR
jgi:uncharacterized iron-regulated protein